MITKNTINFLATLGAILALGAPRVRGESGETTGPDSALDYASFSLLLERNIFDPNRSAVRPWTPESEIQETARIVPEDNINLLGTMITPDWSVAIFKGSSSQFDIKCRTGEAIAEFKIIRIGTDSVTLADDVSTSATMILPVGYRLQRHGDEPWSVTRQSAGSLDYVGSEAPVTMTNDSNPAESPPATSGSAGGGADDILKKMMERRQQEINK